MIPFFPACPSSDLKERRLEFQASLAEAVRARKCVRGSVQLPNMRSTISNCFLRKNTWMAILVGMVFGGNPQEVLAQEGLSDFEVIARDVYAALPADRPGFGTIDYEGNPKGDIPKAYAEVLLAELERARHGLLTELPSLAAITGSFLLDHADENYDGVIGWGLPVAWDAYGDGSINPANSEYTITTAIVADSLLTWMEQDPDAPGDRILETLEKAFSPYLLPDMKSPSGLLPYSLSVGDRAYDTFNPAAYLAGEMQRFSGYAKTEEIRTGLRRAADRTMQVLLDNQKTSPLNGSLYWNYSITEEVPNDLGHAVYIVQGIAAYVRAGGALGDSFDLDRAFAHLEDFDDDRNRRISQWPVWREDVQISARTYDLGSALALACSFPRFVSFARNAAMAAASYLDANGRYQKHPYSNDTPGVVINEYEAYLYRGAVACLVPDRRAKEILNDIDLRPPAASPAPAVTSSGCAPVFVDQALAEPQQCAIGRSGFVPISTGLAGGRAMFLRSLLDDGIVLRLLSEGGETLDELKVTTHTGAQPMFRAAVSDDNEISAILYDNFRGTNELVRFMVHNRKLEQVGQTVALPSLEDPAGRTYEMIPKLFMLKSAGKLDILGGTLSATLSGDQLVEQRISGCQRVIEAVATPEGPVALCARKPEGSPDARSGSFFLVGPNNLQLPALLDQGLPFNLVYKNGRVAIEHAKTANDLRRMFAKDVATSQQSGWLEYGVSNTEGRIAWSQIYYLNGFLDILLLTARDADMKDVFGPLTDEIRARVLKEMAEINKHYASGEFRTRAFTVDRSATLFAVQTSRLLLLMLRVRDELGDETAISELPSLRHAVSKLEKHIEVLDYGVEPPRWMPRDAPSLVWPKGSQFYFDGVSVPFNHQNEWAYALAKAVDGPSDPIKVEAQDIIKHFIRRITSGGSLPATGEWNYWWGRAYDGWTKDNDISINRPEYAGDLGRAWISFRTIDSMSLMAAAKSMDGATRETVYASVRALLSAGKLYPFANYELVQGGQKPVLSCDTARAYARITSPWEIESAAWAMLRLAKPGCL